jgi:hypothetical protein
MSLQNVFERIEGLEGLPLDQHLLQAAKVIDQVMEKSRRDLRELYANARRALSVEVPGGGRVLPALKSIVAFSDAFDAHYYAVS